MYSDSRGITGQCRGSLTSKPSDTATKKLFASRKFRFLALEAAWTETRQLNRYLVDGKGDISKLVAGVGFWLWDTNEFVDLMRWIRKTNRTRPRSQRIWILGVDAQSPVAAVQSIQGIARAQKGTENDPKGVSLLKELADGRRRRFIRSLDQIDVDALLTHIESTERSMPSEDSPTLKEALARRDSFTLRQAIALARSKTFLDGEHARDRFMA